MVETDLPAGRRIAVPVQGGDLPDNTLSDGSTFHVTFDVTNGAFTVGNQPGVAMPSTGDGGTAPVYAAGVSMLALALPGWLRKGRKRSG